MMITADALVALLALIAFLCLIYGPWQSVCTDVARQLIFERRDALFDLACAGHLDFKSPEYKAIRRSLEAMIRYAHELTWPGLLFARLRGRHLPVPPSPLKKAIESIENPVIREKVNVLVKESTATLIGMIGAKSVLLMPIVIAVVIYAVCTHGFGRITRKAQNTTLFRGLAGTIQSGADCTV